MDRMQYLAALAGDGIGRMLEGWQAGHPGMGVLALGEIGGSTLWSYPPFHNARLVASLW